MTTSGVSDVPAIELRGITRVYERRKRFRGVQSTVTALSGVDLAIPVGEVHGLLGPNGAGKTTICKILSTILTPTSGTAAVLGFDVMRQSQEVRRRLGLVLGGEQGLYYRLTARQFLRYWGALYGLDDRTGLARAAELLERVGLTDRANDRIETYSRGMKQRLHLARGLISDAPVLLLDEPTTGMDPVAARDFRDLIREIRPGRTVLLTTHDMVEAEALCDRVSLVNHGEIIATEAPRTLSTWITRYERVDVADASDAVVAALESVQGVASVARGADGAVRVETSQEGTVERVLRLLLDAGVTGVRTSLPDLEEVYLQLIGGREDVPA